MTAVDERGEVIWRPYEDAPLLKPEMLLGLNACDAADREHLRSYIRSLIIARRAPVHINVAFNAVYFGYDIDESSYVGAIDLFRLPRISAGEVTDALPVGALVDIEATADPLFAEVVYKEGAHPQIDAVGEVPAWVSGAPIGAPGPGLADASAPMVTRERLVVDFDAFGTGLCATSKQIDRLRRKQRGMDADGHLLLDACYPDRVTANLDDMSYYARYLVTSGRKLLLSADLPEPLRALLSDVAGDGQLEAAVLALLDTVGAVFRSLEDDIRVWNGYAFTRGSYSKRLGDSGPLGRGDLETLAAQMAKAAIPAGPRRQKNNRPSIAYTATGPALRALHGSARHLSSLDYAAVVCHANTLLNDYVRCEVDEQGLLSNGVHLRLDDVRQGGGIWRAEYPGSSYTMVAPDEPLGLGWAGEIGPNSGVFETTADDGEQPQWNPPELDELEPDPDELGPAITDSVVTWAQSLRLKHLIEGYLPIHPAAAEQMHLSHIGGDRLSLELKHDGDQLAADEAHQSAVADLFAEHPRLTRVEWPWEFNVGMILTCTWRRHSRTVRAMTTLLDEPVLVDGEMIEHRFDPRVLTREACEAPSRDRGVGTESEPSQSQLVLRAVRRLGLLDADGRAVLARSHLHRAVYGVDGEVSPLLDDAISELVRVGKLHQDVASIDGVRQLTHPAMSGLPTVPVLVYEPLLVPVAGSLTPRVPGRTRLEPRYVRRSPVSGHLRRIGHLGYTPSAAARVAYAEHLRSLGMPVRELPPGCTFRREG